MEIEEYDSDLVDKSLTLEVEGETHTLGNILRDVMWTHPHIELASYSQEHPSKNEILLRCQTSGLISGEQATVEALHMTKEMLEHVETTMNAAVAEYEAKHGVKVDKEVSQ